MTTCVSRTYRIFRGRLRGIHRGRGGRRRAIVQNITKAVIKICIAAVNQFVERVRPPWRFISVGAEIEALGVPPKSVVASRGAWRGRRGWRRTTYVLETTCSDSRNVRLNGIAAL